MAVPEGSGTSAACAAAAVSSEGAGSGFGSGSGGGGGGMRFSDGHTSASVSWPLHMTAAMNGIAGIQGMMFLAWEGIHLGV